MKVMETDRLNLRWLTPDDAAIILEPLNCLTIAPLL